MRKKKKHPVKLERKVPIKSYHISTASMLVTVATVAGGLTIATQ